MPPKAARGLDKARAARSVERMRRALTSVRDRPVEDLKFLEVVRVISAATGLSMKQLAAANLASAPADDARVLLGDDAQIEPGHPLHPYALQWQRLVALRGKTM